MIGVTAFITLYISGVSQAKIFMPCLHEMTLISKYYKEYLYADKNKVFIQLLVSSCSVIIFMTIEEADFSLS